MWVCKIIDHDLPVVCETREEAMKILEHWNNSSLEGEGKISEDIFDFTFGCGETKTVTSLILTCDGFEEDNSYAQAFLHDYKEYILKDDSRTVNKTNLHPVFAQQDTSNILCCMRTKINPPSITVLKQIVAKDIQVETQTEVYDWISNNVKKNQDKLENYVDIHDMIISNARILGSTSLRLVDKVILGENIKNLLMDNLNLSNTTPSSYENHEEIYYKDGTTYLYDTLNRVPPNSFILCVNDENMCSSGFIVEMNGKKYLNPIEDVDGYSSFDDFTRIINVG